MLMKKSPPPPCKMEFGHDEFGQEILLKDGHFQVMMQWEKPYMEACIDALKPAGDVLEVGFGCGYSSTRIQHYHPKSHTIIEYHPEVAKRARKWAEKYSNVTIVEDTWQNALDTLGVFDTIFFDDYPLESAAEQAELEKSGNQASMILSAGKKKMAELEAQLSFLKDVKYADADIDAFFILLENEKVIDPKVFLRFFYELEEKKNITKSQLEKVFLRLVEKRYTTQKAILQFLEELKTASNPTQRSVRYSRDRLFEFLDRCLTKHMRKGSRFSCYLNDPISKYEDEKFFNLVITNPFLEYHEQRIPIDVPANCQYYKGNEALVITITKLTAV